MILFVDDEPFFVDAYYESLKEEGFDVLLEKRLKTAMKVFRERRDDITLVITDIMMPPGGAFETADKPDLDLTTGFAFYDWIRKESPTIPVIVLTNNTMPEVDQKFGAEPNCVVFRKGPYCPSGKLIQQVRDMLDDEPLKTTV